MTYRTAYYMPARPELLELLESRLPENFELVRLPSFDWEARLAAAADLDFLVAELVTPELLDRAPKLRMVHTPGVGYDGIDLEACKARGIPVAHTLSGISVEVAEHVFLLMLAVARKLIPLDRGMRQGHWGMWDYRLSCSTLAGKTLGLIGMGRIGKEVARRAEAFGIKVVYADLIDVPGYERLPLDELLATSDIVSLHTPLTPETRNLMNRERFAKMKQGAILISAARGPVVDEEALHEALTSGRLAGAGLDVFAKEPVDPANPLLQLDNAVLTPHTATGTLESHEAKVDNYVRNFLAVLEGREIEGRLA